MTCDMIVVIYRHKTGSNSAPDVLRYLLMNVAIKQLRTAVESFASMVGIQNDNPKRR